MDNTNEVADTIRSNIEQYETSQTNTEAENDNKDSNYKKSIDMNSSSLYDDDFLGAFNSNDDDDDDDDDENDKLNTNTISKDNSNNNNSNVDNNNNNNDNNNDNNDSSSNTTEVITDIIVPKTNGELRMYIEGKDDGLFVTGFKTGLPI